MLRLIKTECLLEGAEVGENIYGARGHLLITEGTRLTEKQIAHLAEMGIPEVAVVTSRLRDIMEPSLVQSRTKTRALAALNTFFETLQNGQTAINLDELRGSAEEIVADIQDLQLCAFVNFPVPQIAGHYLVVHALYTGILSAALGYLAGLREHLLEITAGGLLSDTGLMLLPKPLLDKPGPLDATEMEPVRQHPTAAVKLLSQAGAYTKAIVYQHHERADGSGYPKGIGHREIHPYSALVGLADIYVAMLADRPYRRALLPHSALEVIMTMAGWEFDKTLVEQFINAIPPYPVGTFVHLSSGEKGVVVAIPESICRPVIRILHDANGAEVEPHEINLSAKEHQTILIDEVLFD